MSDGTPNDERCPTQFNFGIRLGLVFIVETACLSAVASAALLTYIGVCRFSPCYFLPHCYVAQSLHL